MHCEIIDCYSTYFFFVEVQVEKKNLEKYFLGARVGAPKLVYWSPKWPGYITDNIHKLLAGLQFTNQYIKLAHQ